MCINSRSKTYVLLMSQRKVIFLSQSSAWPILLHYIAFPMESRTKKMYSKHLLKVFGKNWFKYTADKCWIKADCSNTKQRNWDPSKISNRREYAEDKFENLYWIKLFLNLNIKVSLWLWVRLPSGYVHTLHQSVWYPGSALLLIQLPVHTQSGRHQMMAHILGSLSLTWEVCMVFWLLASA